MSHQKNFNGLREKRGSLICTTFDLECIFLYHCLFKTHTLVPFLVAVGIVNIFHVLYLLPTLDFIFRSVPTNLICI